MKSGGVGMQIVEIPRHLCHWMWGTVITLDGGTIQFSIHNGCSGMLGMPRSMEGAIEITKWGEAVFLSLEACLHSGYWVRRLFGRIVRNLNNDYANWRERRHTTVKVTPIVMLVTLASHIWEKCLETGVRCVQIWHCLGLSAWWGNRG